MGVPAAIANAIVSTRRTGYRKWLRLLNAFVIVYLVIWYAADLLITEINYGALMVAFIRPAILLAIVLFLSNAIANWDTRH